ncbi:MAG: sigma-70 family RNA polymerase sigma factor [Candidatus Riflebacteria bacterium]|nr:sigma-70 family RNA polymerase sigma factor [Candidatus Riflebacteria bacterium]
MNPDLKNFEKLLSQNLGLLMGFLGHLGVPYDSKEDLAQETFLRAYKYFDKYDSTKPFSAWLLKIGRNVFADFRAKLAKKISAESTSLPPISINYDEEIIERGNIRELLSELTDEERFLIEMKVVLDHSFPEIAELTGEAEGTLRVKFHRLMSKIRLKSENDEKESG